jgi:SPP1 family predicted phage head-tail adaptor
MNSAILNRRITFQRLTKTVDVDGYPIKQWDNLKTVWAGKNNITGREYYAAAAIQAENTVIFKIKYLKTLDSEYNDEGLNTTKMYRIKYNGLYFNIQYIDDVKTQHIEMDIRTLRQPDK